MDCWLLHLAVAELLIGCLCMASRPQRPTRQNAIRSVGARKELHGTVFSSAPSHGFPPFWASFATLRILVFRPVLHGLLQTVQECQAANSQSTEVGDGVHGAVSFKSASHGVPPFLETLAQCALGTSGLSEWRKPQTKLHPPPGYQSAQSANKQSIGTQPWQSGRPGQSPNSVMVPWQVFWLATSHIPEGVVVNVLENGGGVGYGVAGGGVGYGVVGAT
eukprot:CAMPEP_0169103920 /NCGR_PEP_ID=MMETSP1015-20121227/22982_1 /TAXON_ID=342587 /ORGANISM="Karlodinium micrum, Strain CCMP2283" /LENGTH=218 /DNA_ID=CAMNT_0009165169 /DNA_START=3850 /DNA_END=4508 /DNA_ORIENTATION=-